MQNTPFDVLTQNAALTDRKTAIKMLGGSLAAIAMARPLASEAAKNKNKKRKRKAKKRCRQKCAQQVAPCQISVNQNGGTPAQIACCQRLADCDFSGLLLCLSG
jgi:hypothetical protein